MTARSRSVLLCALLALLAGAVTLTLPSGPAASAATGPRARSAAKPVSYSPPQGPTFNNPLGTGEQQYKVLNVIQDAIKHTPRRGNIRIMSWNIMSRTAVDALLAAQRRGVKIRVLMDDSNLTEIDNPYFRRLRRGFLAENKNHAPDRRSYAKTCVHSCRGKGGQAHAKYYLFSRTGSAKQVLMEGSANMTAAAATNQWNDIFTFIGNQKLYKFAGHVFHQMWQDQPVAEPFVKQVTQSAKLYFSPFRGPTYKANPVLSLLNRTRCLGAANGNGGHTIVRIAPDVMRNERGMLAARRIREMWVNGCDVRLVYTVMGRDIHDYLIQDTKRGPVPMRHLVQDYNGDGEFDNYFHLKAISINGHVGDDKSAFFTVNGSANMSGNSSASDENIAIMPKKWATLAYQKYITYWYDNQPKSARPIAGRRSTHVDPYAHVDMD